MEEGAPAAGHRELHHAAFMPPQKVHGFDLQLVVGPLVDALGHAAATRWEDMPGPAKLLPRSGSAAEAPRACLGVQLLAPAPRQGWPPRGRGATGAGGAPPMARQSAAGQPSAAAPTSRAGWPQIAAPSPSEAKGGHGEEAASEKAARDNANRWPSDTGSMGGNLRALQSEDPQCVLLARRCNALGFQSEEALTSHCSKFGRVRRVLVAHSKVKARGAGSAACPAIQRLRPGSIAFIAMADAESAERILREGGEQTVAGARISLEPFRVRPPGSPSAGPSERGAGPAAGCHEQGARGPP